MEDESSSLLLASTYSVKWKVSRESEEKSFQKKTVKVCDSLWEFLLWLSRSRSRHNVCEDPGSIPGLSQWVKDLALRQASV